LDPREASAWPVDVGIEHLMSTTELIARAGHKPGSSDYALSAINGEIEPLQHLRLAPNETLHCIERVRTADELPVIFCRDYISTERVPGRIMAQYLGAESLFGFLSRECGLRVIAARADILPALPSPRVADLLRVSRRNPLLVLHQVHYDGDGTPFLYSENHFNLEYMGVHVRRTPST
jgi:GntR family transcriptional regulator